MVIHRMRRHHRRPLGFKPDFKPNGFRFHREIHRGEGQVGIDGFLEGTDRPYVQPVVLQAGQNGLTNQPHTRQSCHWGNQSPLFLLE